MNKADYRGWVAVDLDGTLAQYTGWQGPTSIGEPVPLMLARVKQWLSEGRDVRIYTARVSHNGTEERIRDAEMSRIAIEDWCQFHLGRVLPVTNAKDYAMTECWDDRCVQVHPNTGRRVDGKG